MATWLIAQAGDAPGPNVTVGRIKAEGLEPGGVTLMVFPFVTECQHPIYVQNLCDLAPEARIRRSERRVDNSETLYTTMPYNQIVLMSLVH